MNTKKPSILTAPRSAMPYSFLALSAMLTLVAGCQSKEEAVWIACDAPNKVDPSLPPAERGQALANLIGRDVKNRDVLALLESPEHPTEKANKLNELAKSYHIETCSLAALWSNVPTPTAALSQVPPPRFLPPVLEPQVLGELPMDAIQQTMQRQSSKLRACYEAGFRRDHSLAGVVLVRFVVGTEGNVIEATDAGSTLSDPQVVDCLLQEIRKTTFPKPKNGNATVLFPIQLRLDATAAASASHAPASASSAPPSPPAASSP
ncbi:MAG TPA: AgmX/PglI C-terminal domain-containing protein [Polyangiaceae bacterium]|jgi:hypothetical protein|nr:MAG: hypothetical protein BWY17_00151 [Deltaproteobacteria bacterium ADurb.Bin207]HNS99071.1 AgmX/PglI C-terminal domain-containing protein [Polyangiaceae bacterium]HNZ22717.1 AgmX/PglI C-terminal domain-containing protein [Polyangiaceae bacterium]HOD24352.1 AgmX/PglI C-terminal domain-containing protein [Polyangiaceae bacterium]HOE49239.1 AgmX/PglI C-terminal domain-containing protein [Polyangiaceae bacterium]